MKKRFYKWIISISSLLLLVSIPSFAASDLRILVLPFDIHTSGDLSFLQKGIQEMLNTRLAAVDGIEVIDDDDSRSMVKSLVDPITEPVALSLGKKLKADFVVIGDVSLLGEEARTDSRLIDTENGLSRLNFSQQGKTQGNVLSHINQLAGEISGTLLGKPKTDSVKVPEQPVPAASAGTGESHQHPEKLWKGIDQLSHEPLKTVAADGKTPVLIWKSPKFEGEIRSIAKGDIDGDRKDEVILILDNTISVFRYQDGKLLKFAETAPERDTYFFRVDVGDINGNGRAEIFVNRLIREKTRVKSLVLEWDGNQLVRTAEIDRYLRVEKNQSGDMLLGQESGRSGLFASTIDRMSWQNGAYGVDGSLSLPSGATVFSYSQGNALNDGRDILAQMTQSGFIEISDASGEVEWMSPERFTGSAAYLPYPSDDSSDRQSDVPRKKRYYLPQRILIYDIDRDGKNELLVINNKDLTTHLLPNLRIFKNGHIECLVWDGLGMSSKWKTSDVTGHVSDVMIADLNADSQPEMVFSVISSQSSAFTSGESYLVFWAPN